MPRTAPPPPRRRPYVGLPLAWAALMLVLTLTPARNMPEVPPWELISFDTAAHAFVFFVLALLSGFSTRRQRRWPWLHRHAFGLMLIVGILFGMLIEVLQTTMRLGRQGEWLDVVGDALGTTAGLLVLWPLRRWWS